MSIVVIVGVGMVTFLYGIRQGKKIEKQKTLRDFCSHRGTRIGTILGPCQGVYRFQTDYLGQEVLSVSHDDAVCEQEDAGISVLSR